MARLFSGDLCFSLSTFTICGAYLVMLTIKLMHSWTFFSLMNYFVYWIIVSLAYAFPSLLNHRKCFCVDAISSTILKKKEKFFSNLKFTKSIFRISEILVNFLTCECDKLLHLHLRQYYLVTLCIYIQILKLLLIMEREELRQFSCVSDYQSYCKTNIIVGSC